MKLLEGKHCLITGGAGSIGGATAMGREFLPKLDEGTMVAAMVRLPSVSLEQSTEQAVDVVPVGG